MAIAIIVWIFVAACFIGFVRGAGQQRTRRED
jgi:hypothetical protein